MNGKRIYALCGWLLAAATIMLSALLVAQCIAVYAAGNARENIIAEGVHRADVFSPETIARHLAPIAWAAWLWLIIFIVTVALRLIFGNTERSEKLRPVPVPRSGNVRALRIILACAALVLIALGIMNGGMRDVFVKAANICTECIGLG